MWSHLLGGHQDSCSHDGVSPSLQQELENQHQGTLWVSIRPQGMQEYESTVSMVVVSERAFFSSFCSEFVQSSIAAVPSLRNREEEAMKCFARLSAVS